MPFHTPHSVQEALRPPLVTAPGAASLLHCSRSNRHGAASHCGRDFPFPEEYDFEHSVELICPPFLFTGGCLLKSFAQFFLCLFFSF